jgi:hypothetical protein
MYKFKDGIISESVSYIGETLRDMFYYGLETDYRVTKDMKALDDKHIGVYGDIAHLYVVDEMYYEDICKFTFVGKKWKCTLDIVATEIKKILAIKKILSSAQDFIGYSIKISSKKYFTKAEAHEYLDKLNFYLCNIAQTIKIFDRFIQFLSDNLI